MSNPKNLNRIVFNIDSHDNSANLTTRSKINIKKLIDQETIQPEAIDAMIAELLAIRDYAYNDLVIDQDMDYKEEILSDFSIKTAAIQIWHNEIWPTIQNIKFYKDNFDPSLDWSDDDIQSYLENDFTTDIKTEAKKLALEAIEDYQIFFKTFNKLMKNPPNVSEKEQIDTVISNKISKLSSLDSEIHMQNYDDLYNKYYDEEWKNVLNGTPSFDLTRYIIQYFLQNLPVDLPTNIMKSNIVSYYINVVLLQEKFDKLTYETIDQDLFDKYCDYDYRYHTDLFRIYLSK